MGLLHEILRNREFSVFIFFILGACLASFFNVYSLRYNIINESNNASEIKSWLNDKNLILPEGLESFITKFSISFPSSHCYACKNPLKWYHNIPIISYLFLRGKCGYCKCKISIQYPTVEFFGGVLSTVAYLTQYTENNLIGFVFVYIFFIITYLLLVIDAKTMYLPDELTYPLLWIGLVSYVINNNTFGSIDLRLSVLGVITGYLSLFVVSFVGKKLKGFEVMGGGDLKLLAAIGAFIGPIGAIYTFFIAPFVGLITWALIRASGNKEVHIPYGPSLILGSYIYIYFGEQIKNFLI